MQAYENVITMVWIYLRLLGGHFNRGWFYFLLRLGMLTQREKLD